MPDQSNRTVLLVEDSAADREVVRRLLRQHKRAYTILEAHSGAEGLAICERTPVDCVILDFYLSDMDGLQFLDALAAPTGQMPLAVALVTARDDDATAAEVLARGAQDYLVKEALTSHALVRAVENTIEKFRILHELDEQRAAVELRARAGRGVRHTRRGCINDGVVEAGLTGSVARRDSRQGALGVIPSERSESRNRARPDRGGALASSFRSATRYLYAVEYRYRVRRSRRARPSRR